MNEPKLVEYEPQISRQRMAKVEPKSRRRVIAPYTMSECEQDVRMIYWLVIGNACMLTAIGVLVGRMAGAW